MCAPCFKFALFSMQSNYVQSIFSLITVFYDISKQIQQRQRIGKIFASWHLAIAITSLQFIFFSKQPFNGIIWL